MTTLSIKKMEFNEDLEGFILTISNGKTVDIQLEIESNRLHADYDTHCAIINKTDDYYDLNDEEEKQVEELISENEEIKQLIKGEDYICDFIENKITARTTYNSVCKLAEKLEKKATKEGWLYFGDIEKRMWDRRQELSYEERMLEDEDNNY